MLGDASPPIAKKFQWASAIRKNRSGSFQVLAYFLNNGNPVRNSGLSVVQSLLYQVLSADHKFFRYVRGKQLFRRQQQGDFGQYMELLRVVLQGTSLSETVIVLDALDQCEESPRSLFIESMKAIAYQSKVKVLFTSRSIPAVKIEPSIGIDMDYTNEHVERDINRYVMTAVKDLARERKLPVQLEVGITSKLLKFTSTSFLWVQLALRSIADSLTLRILRNKLDRLTLSLADLYSEALDRSYGLAAVNLRRTLYFVMIAEKPLQVQELSALLAISQTWDSQDRSSQGSDLNTIRMEIAKNSEVEEILENKPINFEEDFMPYFRPLVNLKERSISLAHFTLREFLQQRCSIAYFQTTFELLWADHSARNDAMAEVHSIMAILCLQYMFAAFRDRSDPLEFALYAAIHWTEHARKAGECQNEVLKALITTFFGTTEFVSKWLQTIGDSGYAQGLILPNTPDTPLILATFDLGSFYGDLLGISRESLVTEDINERNPLHFAAANNAISSVFWIMEVCTNEGVFFEYLNSKTDTNLQIPIHLAARNGHKTIVDIPLASMKTEVSFDGDIFESTAGNGHKELFEILYRKTNVTDPHQVMHLLKQAAKLDSVDLIMEILGDLRSLINKGLISSADLSDNRISVLQAALKMHSTTVIDFLLANEDFRDAVDRKRWTALHVAADEGNELVASWLIETGIWINAVNSQGDAALHLATRKGFTELVRRLCDLGAVVDLQNSSGQLPAHLAAEIGDEDILQTLCKYSNDFLDFLHRDAEGRTSLHAASKAGSEAIVHILVAAGANPDTQDNHDRTPVHYVVESRDLRILYFLLIAGADPWTSDNDQICPIHLAAEQGSDLLIRELLKVGVNPDCLDSQGRTPLHHCCSSKVATTIAAGILLESGVKVQATDSKGVQPIHLAAEKDSESLIRLLIAHGADLNCADTEGRSPLHYSCSSKRSTTAVVRLLIHNRINVNHRDHDMNTPLYYAEQNSKKSIIELLKDAGACF